MLRGWLWHIGIERRISCMLSKWTCHFAVCLSAYVWIITSCWTRLTRCAWILVVRPTAVSFWPRVSAHAQVGAGKWNMPSSFPLPQAFACVRSNEAEGLFAQSSLAEPVWEVWAVWCWLAQVWRGVPRRPESQGNSSVSRTVEEAALGITKEAGLEREMSRTGKDLEEILLQQSKRCFWDSNVAF